MFMHVRMYACMRVFTGDAVTSTTLAHSTKRMIMPLQEKVIHYRLHIRLTIDVRA